MEKKEEKKDKNIEETKEKKEEEKKEEKFDPFLGNYYHITNHLLTYHNNYRLFTHKNS